MPTRIKPTPSELMPLYGDLFSRSTIKRLTKEASVKLYWRILTPLITLWGMIYQRLNADHTTDAAVAYLKSGAIDSLDPLDPHPQALSKRLRSESNSAYVQARQRLPLKVVQEALRCVVRRLSDWLSERASTGAMVTWQGYLVRLLDGTTFRMRPFGDLSETYGQPHNRVGVSYWVVAKSVASFCLHTRGLVGYAEGSQATSEPALAAKVMQQDKDPNSLYVGDSIFGVYRVVQVAYAYGHQALLRLEERVAKRLWRLAGHTNQMQSGDQSEVGWTPAPKTKVEPGLAGLPIVGRVLYVRLQHKGFRPIDLYLFTSLLDVECYPIGELCALYGLRWEVEIDYRHVKSRLKMAEFNVGSAVMFRLELAVGLLTYNLICALMVKAADQAELSPMQLSFSRCLRRFREALTQGVPAWVYAEGTALLYLLDQLGLCKLPCQPGKVKHEPRKVRRRPESFPALKGDREAARKHLLAEMASNSIS